MKLSTRARYALRMVLDVAKNHGEERPVSLGDVAERTGLSRGYLEQLAVALRNTRVLRGVAGRRGGYRLSRPAAEISIGDIIESAIGPICVVDCLESPESCPIADYCECRVLFSLINQGIKDVAHQYTLADLLEPSWLRSAGGRRETAVKGGAWKPPATASRSAPRRKGGGKSG